MIDSTYLLPGVPTPGILLEGTHRRRKPWSPTRRAAVSAVVSGLGVWGLVYEALHGWPTGLRLWFVLTIPLAVLWAIVIVIGLCVLLPPTNAPWYQAWSFVEYFDVPHGMRLVVGRQPADQPGLVVRRGEVVEVHATLISSRRAGLEREYAFRIVAPSGTIELTQTVWIEHLTMAPLEARAATWGIAVTAHGAATEIRRLATASEPR